MKHKWFRIAGISLLTIAAVAILGFLVLYFWPVQTKELQTGLPQTITYEESVTRIASKKSSEKSSGVTRTCQSIFKDHGSATAKTVVIFHGITACPDQQAAFGDFLFDAGYNVYIPVAPFHGTTDLKDHGQVTATDLITYVNNSITIATGLGQEVGVAGLSGGGVLATWAAEYRPEVKRLLVLSPFYEPAASQAPKWQLPLLKKLYGYHWLADSFSNGSDETNPGFSYRALANYLIITENINPNSNGLGLKSIGAVVSGSDDVIDLELGLSLPSKIATANNVPFHSATIPAEWKAGHPITSLDIPGVLAHENELYELYLAFYEGNDARLE